jgi:catecholate siderophore receptor
MDMAPIKSRKHPLSRTLSSQSLTAASLLTSLALGAPMAANAGGTPAVAGQATPTELDRVKVHGQRPAGYTLDSITSATRTRTPLRDTPQAISIVTRELMRDQGMNALADVVRYLPGVSMAQGEGNRDTTVIRGSSSTADFFVDGLRDDVQYIRDVYNIERVEALKGPNAMVFGRGGSGGVLNRVTRKADWQEHHEITAQAGSWNRSRFTIDQGQPLNERAAFRVTGMAEDSASYRDGVTIERYGINPTLALQLGETTTAIFGYEHFRDDRVADRGVPSRDGRPLATDPETFFGNPELSPVWARVNAFDAVIHHDFASGAWLRNATRYAVYDKFYQNVFPGSLQGDLVSLGAYNNRTDRENLFNQTDLGFTVRTGGVTHALLAGMELGRQETDNFRQSGAFPANSSCRPGTPAVTNSMCVPLADPRYRGPVDFAQSATDADNHGVAKVAALYLQDQIEFSPHWQAVLGVRLDRFEMDLRNNRNGERFRTEDDLLSPRVGLVYKPAETVSVYTSYSVTHLPRSGDQLSSLNAGNQALDPEQFRNKELGAKWDVRPGLSLTAAAYRLDRTNVAVANPDYDPVTNPGVPTSILVDGQRSEGLELGIAGNVSDRWQVMGGYAWQDGENRTNGRDLANLPRHTVSLWNRYDFTPAFGAGLGAVYRDAMYAAADNAVVLPGYTRIDAALFYRVNASLQLQLNVENLLDREHYASAHNNNNITPGTPRAWYLGLNMAF